MRSRMSSSSSTIRTSDAICDPFLLIACSLVLLLPRREGHHDLRAMHPVVMVVRILSGILQPQLAALVFGDLAHDRGPEPGALGARRDVRLGQPVAMLVRQADAV